LLLRPWREEDFPLFTQLNADPEVMAYFPNTLSATESDAMANRIKSLIEEKGWGFWAVEHVKDKAFMGFVGLNEPTYDLPVNPCIEIGWRLVKKYWGKGYASEAGLAALKVAFETLHLNEVYAFTPVSNLKSRAVMQRLGMINTDKNFEHPMVPENHVLREHVLYKIDKQSWIEK